MNVLALSFALKALGRDIANAEHEPEVAYLPQVIMPGSTCLHIGASDGRHAFAILRRIPGTTIHAFEPASFAMTVLRQGIAMRGCGRRIRTEKLAIGDTAGDLTLVTPRKKKGIPARSYAFLSRDGASTRADFDGSGHYEERVPVVRLDDLGLPPVDFIRMDIEGAEMDALRGGVKLLRQCLPHFLIEVHPVILKERFGTSSEELAAFFRGLGYRFFKLSEGEVVEVDSLELDQPYGDFFVIHPGRPLPDGVFRDRVGAVSMAAE